MKIIKNTKKYVLPVFGILLVGSALLHAATAPPPPPTPPPPPAAGMSAAEKKRAQEWEKVILPYRSACVKVVTDTEKRNKILAALKDLKESDKSSPKTDATVEATITGSGVDQKTAEAVIEEKKNPSTGSPSGPPSGGSKPKTTGTRSGPNVAAEAQKKTGGPSDAGAVDPKIAAEALRIGKLRDSAKKGADQIQQSDVTAMFNDFLYKDDFGSMPKNFQLYHKNIFIRLYIETIGNNEQKIDIDVKRSLEKIWDAYADANVKNIVNEKESFVNKFKASSTNDFFTVLANLLKLPGEKGSTFADLATPGLIVGNDRFAVNVLQTYKQKEVQEYHQDALKKLLESKDIFADKPDDWDAFVAGVKKKYSDADIVTTEEIKAVFEDAKKGKAAQPKKPATGSGKKDDKPSAGFMEELKKRIAAGAGAKTTSPPPGKGAGTTAPALDSVQALLNVVKLKLVNLLKVVSGK
ncbi:MAG: hypothetical protein H6679_05565 [Epsilonproteobacteria bacterium]|nr:hypothetical protein [Campylobacterota bacterium]